MGSFGGHDQPLCRLLKRSCRQEVDRSGILYFFLIQVAHLASVQPIRIIRYVMKQIRPTDSARVVVFLEQTPVRDRRGIMARNIADGTVFISSSFPHLSSGGFPVLARSCSRFPSH